MANFGIPYMGSKDKIILQIGHIFPKADHFYDLFGGGFAVTHYMIQRRSKHYKHFHFNEIRTGICDLIKSAINGDYNYDKYKMPWVTREEFLDNKETNAFYKILWSFGNNGESYIFGKDIENYKKSLHQCVVFGEFDEIAETVTGFKKWPENIPLKGRRLFIRNRVEYFRKTKIPKILEQFLNTKQLQQLQQLQQLERLQRLSFYTGDYRKVPIKKNSVIYCDIPYQGTADYGEFNHKEFFDWAAIQTEPVFISEYEIKDPRFKLIKEIKTRAKMSGGAKTAAVERLYVTNHG